MAGFIGRIKAAMLERRLMRRHARDIACGIGFSYRDGGATYVFTPSRAARPGWRRGGLGGWL
jgi:hypothetical protein